MARQYNAPRGFETMPLSHEQAAFLDRAARDTFMKARHLPFDMALSVVLLTGMNWAVEAMVRREEADGKAD